MFSPPDGEAIIRQRRVGISNRVMTHLAFAQLSAARVSIITGLARRAVAVQAKVDSRVRCREKAAGAALDTALAD